MCIGVTLKRYRAVKEVGEIKMTVGIFSHYELMQVCQTGKQFSLRNGVLPIANHVANGYMHNAIAASNVDVILPPSVRYSAPVPPLEFQPLEVCPRNFIIFDQTENRSQIMFHPAIAHRFDSPGLNILGNYVHEKFVGKDENIDGKDEKDENINDRELSSSAQEDLEDIDALLSLEEEDQEEYDEEEMSTARTHGNYRSSSPDSCCNYGSKPKKNRFSSLSIHKSSSSGSSCNIEWKRQKIKKMVKALRGIVPGADQMNSVAVLDEAIRYLKSLKVEVQKLGYLASIRNVYVIALGFKSMGKSFVEFLKLQCSTLREQLCVNIALAQSRSIANMLRRGLWYWNSRVKTPGFCPGIDTPDCTFS
ncbi:hypothetical protein RJ641_001866 [Dillenia turbinata]|uniref:BHLH domain-containing protein n=1 Tax=Dillenia turbinata TaxID=194707 RepID=A0AAN8VMJ8_9MAGN